jgi:hypothetical protein
MNDDASWTRGPERNVVTIQGRQQSARKRFLNKALKNTCNILILKIENADETEPEWMEDWLGLGNSELLQFCKLPGNFCIFPSVKFASITVSKLRVIVKS